MEKEIECLGKKSKDQGCRGCTIINGIERDIKKLNGRGQDEITIMSVIYENSKDCPEGMQPIIDIQKSEI